MGLSANHGFVLWISLMFLLTIPIAISQQQQLPTWAEQESYEFPWSIRRVAVIGAGPSGLVAYREFVRAGFEVFLFERDSVPGGTWHYTEDGYTNTPIPNADLSIGDFVPSLPPEGVTLPYEEQYDGEASNEILRVHRAPKPIWKSMRTAVPRPFQEFPELPWPAGQPLQLPHHKVAQYVRAFASFHGINSNDIENPRVRYNTRVELVERRFEIGHVRSGWTLTLKEMFRTGRNSSKAVWTKEDFDAVVVAVGRYNAPHVANIPGLNAWVDRFPDRLTHSRQYRQPQPYANQTVLIIGASESATQIAIDMAPYAKHIYQSVREDKSGNPLLRMHLKLLPSNVTIIPEIKRFSSVGSSIVTSPVEFVNGTLLDGIDSVIFATGYRFSFPFLPQFHNSSRTAKDADLKPIVTDGTHLRNLYLDILSIEEPTLGFTGMNTGALFYKYAEYVAVALSKVWGNQAKIPSTPQLWRQHGERVAKNGGYGKYLQSLGITGTNEMIRLFVGWLNDAAVKYGGRQVTMEQWADLDLLLLWTQALYGVKNLIDLDNSTNLEQSFFETAIRLDWNQRFNWG